MIYFQILKLLYICTRYDFHPHSLGYQSMLSLRRISGTHFQRPDENSLHVRRAGGRNAAGLIDMVFIPAPMKVLGVKFCGRGGKGEANLASSSPPLLSCPSLPTSCRRASYFTVIRELVYRRPSHILLSTLNSTTHVSFLSPLPLS